MAIINPLEQVKASPRVKLAARLYATGAAKTKKEASQMAGIHENYLTMLTQPSGGSVKVKAFMSDIERRLDEGTINMSQVIQTLGRKAVMKLGHLMESDKEEIQFRAAQDLADRSPETQKTTRHEVTALSLSGDDAKEIARAMVESAQYREEYSGVISGDLIEVEDLKEQQEQRDG
jgi:predicted nucleotide-binding protein